MLDMQLIGNQIAPVQDSDQLKMFVYKRSKYSLFVQYMSSIHGSR